MRRCNALFTSLFALSYAAAAQAQTAACILERTVDTGAVLSSSLIQQINEFPENDALGGYAAAPLLGPAGDYNRDGVQDFLAVQGAELRSVVIRSGSTGDVLWGPFDTGANSIPNQLSTIGDFDGDGRQEFAIGVRRSDASRADGVWVFNGATGQLMEAFPSTISNTARKLDDDDADFCRPYGLGSTRGYMRRANQSGMTAAIAQTKLGKKIVFGDTNSYGGQVLFE